MLQQLRGVGKIAVIRESGDVGRVSLAGERVAVGAHENAESRLPQPQTETARPAEQVDGGR